MRILVVTQYFWPETFRVNDFVLGLKELGHEVIVFTGKPNYPSGKFFKDYSFFGQKIEIWNDVTVYRSPLIPRGNGKGLSLLANYLSFAFLACIKAVFSNIKADLIIGYQQSPVIAVLPAIIYKQKNKCRLFLYIQDLWPESVVATTGVKNRYIISGLNKVTDWIYQQSDIILIQSRAFVEYLIKRRIDKEKIVYLPNTADAFYKPEIPLKELDKYFTNEMNIVFAGNIGEAQSFETLVEAALIVKQLNAGISWIIIGDGRKKDEVIALVNSKNLNDVFKFIGSFPSEMMPLFFARADALLISLKKDFIFSITIPSKLQSYMACARPIIGSLDGEGAEIINNANCGLVSSAEDSQGLANNILNFKKMSESDRKGMAENAILYYEEVFNRNKIFMRLENIITKYN